MTIETALDLGSKAATIVGTLGALLAALWTVHVYFRNRREAAVGEFRKNLHNSVHQFSEMASSFQNQIVGILEEIFDSKNPELVRILSVAKESLKRSSRQEAVNYARSQQQVVHEALLYSLSAETHGLTDTLRFKYVTQIASLAPFSPVLHLFFTDAGALVLQPYNRELSVIRITDYMIDGIGVLWEARDDGSIRLDTSEEVKMHLRAVTAQIMVHYHDNVSLVDIISLTLNLVNFYAAHYLSATGKAQWKHHRRDARASVSRLNADTYTGTLRNIVKWKFKSSRLKSELKDVCRLVDELEGMLKPQERAQKGTQATQ